MGSCSFSLCLRTSYLQSPSFHKAHDFKVKDDPSHRLASALGRHYSTLLRQVLVYTYVYLQRNKIKILYGAYVLFTQTTRYTFMRLQYCTGYVLQTKCSEHHGNLRGFQE